MIETRFDTKQRRNDHTVTKQRGREVNHNITTNYCYCKRQERMWIPSDLPCRSASFRGPMHLCFVAKHHCSTKSSPHVIMGIRLPHR